MWVNGVVLGDLSVPDTILDDYAEEMTHIVEVIPNFVPANFKKYSVDFLYYCLYMDELSFDIFLDNGGCDYPSREFDHISFTSFMGRSFDESCSQLLRTETEVFLVGKNQDQYHVSSAYIPLQTFTGILTDFIDWTNSKKAAPPF